MLTIVISYSEAEKYYEGWAQEEDSIDFDNDYEKALRCTISYAAYELCTYLRKTGLEVCVSDVKGEENIILSVLGNGGESFEIRQEDNDLLLIGDSRKGLLYSVYELLEAQGIRWYSPNDEYVPPLDKLAIPECRKYKYDMPDGRGFHFEGKLKESRRLAIWMARNRMSIHACFPHSKKLQEKLCFTFKTGGHVFTKILDPLNIARDGGYYIDVHKDWYGKRDGEITVENAISVQFCVTNEELLDELAKTVIDKINGDWKNEVVFELAGFDTWGASCSCEECSKLGNGTDRTLHYLSHIRKRIDEAYKDGVIDHQVRLSFDAYEGTDTLEAPINPVPQNLIDAGDYPLFCPILRCYKHNLDDSDCPDNKIYERTLSDWAKTGMMLAMNEYYNVSKYEDLPLLFTERMKYDIPYYIEKGVTEIEYMHTPVLEWGVRRLNQYLLANISRDRYCDADKLMEKYFSDLYGKYSDRVRECYKLIEEATIYCASWRNWFDKSILTHLSDWDGRTVEETFFKESHLGDNAVKSGYETVEKLKKALSAFRSIKNEEIKSLDSAIFANETRALNPADQRKKMEGTAFITRLEEDIRGIIYGIDIFEMMTLCLDYYNSLYEKRGDDASIYEKISSLAEKMSEYNYGVVYLDYIADTELRDTLTRSQLRNLYYKISANRK